MNEVVISQAKRSDGKLIAKLLEEWFDVSRIPWPPSEADAMLEWVLHTIDIGYVVVAQKDGRLLGTAAIQACYLPWNVTQPLMRDAWFYVPRARSRSESSKARVERAARRVPGVANGLMDALKLYCARRKIPLLMAIISGLETERLERWYSIKGGRYCGGVLAFGLEG